jgi:hypothetical protein
MANLGNPATGSGGGVTTRNSQYIRAIDDFNLMRHAVEGQRRIKEESTLYLPKPPALVDPGNDPQGIKYAWYKSFAEFPELVSLSLMGIQGLIHRRPPEIELPSQLEYLRETATPDGKSLEDLWVDATREIFLTGRMGLLPEVYKDSVFLCFYGAEFITNWHKIKSGSGNTASLVTLWEPTEEVIDGQDFATQIVDYYRVLRLDDAGQYVEELWKDEVKAASTGEKIESTMLEEYPIVPSRMGANWDFIPFVPINAVNTEFDIGSIPLLPVAQKSLDVYRKRATYNRTLYLKGDPPMLRTGFSPTEAETANTVGGGVVWDAANPEAKASYIEPTGDSIPAQREAIADDFEEARQAVGRLLDDKKQGIESGEALRERRAAQSVTMVGVLTAAAEGFERALKNVTVVMGGDSDKVVFKPNLDFMSAEITAEDVVKFTTAKNQGAPLANETIHGIYRRGGLTDLEFEAEQELIDDEDPTGVVPTAGSLAGLPGQPAPGDEDEDDPEGDDPDREDVIGEGDEGDEDD